MGKLKFSIICFLILGIMILVRLFLPLPLFFIIGIAGLFYFLIMLVKGRKKYYENTTIRTGFNLTLVSVALSLLGLLFNILALSTNDWRMPVYVKDIAERSQYGSDKVHLFYMDPKEVNLPWLTDVISIGIGKISIGDFMILISIVFSIFILSSSKYKLKRLNKNEK